MDWLRRYRLRNYLKNSIWVPAFSAFFAGLVVFRIARELSPVVGYDFFGFGPEGAQAIMGAVVAATFSFMVFVFSMLLVAVQLASAQLTPRVIASLLGDAASRRALSIFVFSFAFDIGALGRVEGGEVPQLVIFLAVLCTVASVAAFLHLIDHVGTSLRPVSVLSSTGDRGLEVIKDIYPAPFTGVEQDPGIPDPARRSRTILHEGRSGVFLAFDIPGLVELARRAGCVLALKPQVGDFVSNGDVLCEAFGDAAELHEHAVRLSVAIGKERTPEQDPAFAFRHQRSDYRGAGDRPAAAAAQERRWSAPRHGRSARCRGRGTPGVSHTRLGRLREPCGERDPPGRRVMLAGAAAPEHAAGEPDGEPARRAPAGAEAREGSARPGGGPRFR